MKKLVRRLYRALPFKKEVFTLLRRLPLPDSLVRHLQFQGWIQVKGEAGMSFCMYNREYYIEHALFWKGIHGWEGFSNQLWVELCRHSAVIFDIGANTGLYTLLAKAANPKAEVHAFEPMEMVFDDLRRNVAANEFQGVTLVRKALSNTSGTASLYTVADSNLYETSLEQDFAQALPYDQESIRPVEIAVQRLDAYIQENGIARIDLLKIDVETHEPKVVEGMGSYLADMKPVMLIEVLNADVAHALNGSFNADDYRFFALSERDGYTRIDAISKSPTYNVLICPVEKESLALAALEAARSVALAQLHASPKQEATFAKTEAGEN